MASTEYNPRQLTTIAKDAVKGKGTYRRWELLLHSGAFQPLVGVSLRAFYLPWGARRGAWSKHVDVAL